MKDKIKFYYLETGLKGLVVVSARYLLFENRVIASLCKNRAFGKFYWILYSKSVFYLMKVLGYLYPSKYIVQYPLKIYWISPKKIKYKFNGSDVPIAASLRYGRIRAGDWDQKKSLLEEDDVYQSLNEFIRTKDYEKSGLKKLNSQNEENLSSIIKSLKTSGYKTQKELLEYKTEKTFKHHNDGIYPLSNEIEVSIGRNGEFLWMHKGFHRLIIAKTLDIDKIPVRISIIHKKWQEKRESLSSNNKSDGIYENHPDISYLNKDN